MRHEALPQLGLMARNVLQLLSIFRNTCTVVYIPVSTAWKLQPLALSISCSQSRRSKGRKREMSGECGNDRRISGG